jgi:hypothetical protein
VLSAIVFGKAMNHLSLQHVAFPTSSQVQKFEMKGQLIKELELQDIEKLKTA